MLLYTMLYIVLAYLMLFAALTNSVCLNNASFFFLFKYFLCQGYELSGEIALKNNHYYYYYYYYKVSCSRRKHIDPEVRTRDLCIQNRHSNHYTNTKYCTIICHWHAAWKAITHPQHSLQLIHRASSQWTCTQ